MSRPWHLCFTLLVLGLLTLSGVLATPGLPRDCTSVCADDQRFQKLLESVEPAALHDILHEHLKEKFKHGVYQEDKTAMEVVHQQDAEVARNLVELAKRQAGPPSNGTITTTSGIPTIEPTSEEPLTSPPNPTPTPDEPASDSLSPTVSPSASTPSTSSLNTSLPPSSASTTNSQSSTSASGESPSQTTSTTTAASIPPSQTHSSLSTSNYGSYTQSVVYKTTLADGVQSTVTQITVVPADQAASQTIGGSTTNTNTADASLQTNSANGSSSIFYLGVFLTTLNLLFA